MNQLTNAIGRDLPESIEGYGKVRPFAGAFATLPDMPRQAPKVKRALPSEQKLVEDIETVFKQIPIKDGMTLSFHHHLRNGDGVVNLVLAVSKLRKQLPK
ncbi:MAG: citF 1 [Firmicutes bacterium]|nr:citF 1 [Bacillota bacterium]